MTLYIFFKLTHSVSVNCEERLSPTFFLRQHMPIALKQSLSQGGGCLENGMPASQSLSTFFVIRPYVRNSLTVTFPRLPPTINIECLCFLCIHPTHRTKMNVIIQYSEPAFQCEPFFHPAE